jgi:hypothetical protein
MVCKPKKYGALGIVDFQKKNAAAEGRGTRDIAITSLVEVGNGRSVGETSPLT